MTKNMFHNRRLHKRCECFKFIEKICKRYSMGSANYKKLGFPGVFLGLDMRFYEILKSFFAFFFLKKTDFESCNGK